MDIEEGTPAVESQIDAGNGEPEPAATPTAPVLEKPADATGEDGEQPNAGVSPEAQEAINGRINKITAQKYEAEKKWKAAEAKARAAEQRLTELTAEKRPEVPKLPDAYDDDFDAKMAARDQAIRKTAEYDANKAQAQKAREVNAANAQKAQREKVNNSANAFVKRADDIGIDQVTLDQAVRTVSHAGVSREVGMHILEHKDGPIIASYLAANPDKLEKVAKMSPLSAAIEIENSILPMSKKLKPKKSNTPPPPDVPKGGSVPKSSDPMLAGVKFS